MPSLLLAKVLTWKAAAVAGATLAAGGVAVAAAAGVVAPAGSPPHGSGSSLAPAPAAGKASAGPSPSLRGLCQAYIAMPDEARQKALNSAAFEALTAAAGDPADISAFCATASAGSVAQPGRPSAKPSVPASPPTADRPGAHPSTPPHR